MKLNLTREKSKEFPRIENPLDYSDIRIWHCQYQSLEQVSGFLNAKDVEIVTYPDSSLGPIGQLRNLRSLKIVHLPKIRDLTPLAGLEMLELLELSTLPSRTRTQYIDSLQPLRTLRRLRILSLSGFTFGDSSLQHLHSLPNLMEFFGGNNFSIRDLVALKAVTPQIKSRFFTPLVNVPHNFCAKCGSQKVILSGVSKFSLHCPKCHNNRIERHLAEWQAAEKMIAA